MQPRFTLYVLYLGGLFLVFAMLLILPQLLDVLESVPPGPEQEAVAKEVAQKAAAPLLLPAFLLAVLTTGLGAYYRVLPGLRAP